MALDAGCTSGVLLPAEPAGALPPDGIPGTINAYYQQSSTFNRFVFTVRFLCRNGFYVIVDNHTEVAPMCPTSTCLPPTDTCCAQNPTWLCDQRSNLANSCSRMHCSMVQWAS